MSLLKLFVNRKKPEQAVVKEKEKAVGEIDIYSEDAEENDKENDKEYEVVEREILPAKIICPDCGGITLEGLDFCDKCGGELY